MKESHSPLACDSQRHQLSSTTCSLPRILTPGRLRQSAATFLNNLVKRGDAHPEQPCPSAAALYDTNLVKRGGAQRVLSSSKAQHPTITLQRYETNCTTTSTSRAHGIKYMPSKQPRRVRNPFGSSAIISRHRSRAPSNRGPVKLHCDLFSRVAYYE